MPVGPQYSTELGNTSISINGLQYCPAPKCPNWPYAWRKRMVVWPASTPVPNISNSNCVKSFPTGVGKVDFTPSLDCLTLAKKLPSGANSSSNDGSFVGLTTSYQSG